MNNLKRLIAIGFFAAVVIIMLVLSLGESFIGRLSASPSEEGGSFLPVIFGEVGNVPSPTPTSEGPPATNTPTPTSTLTPTSTDTPTLTPTFTPSPTYTPTPTPTRDPRSPEITKFTADDEIINAGGSTYVRWSIDNSVESLELSPGGPIDPELDKFQVSPSETMSYTLTAANQYGSDSAQVFVNVQETQSLLIYDWNKPVEKKNHGFPSEQPPRANGDWTNPVNFAEGTLKLQVVIKSMPVPQTMRLQFCIWQNFDYSIESCTYEKEVEGFTGNVVSWDVPMDKLLPIHGVVDYTQPRQRFGVAIKNSEGSPVSDYNDYNWGGEDPNEWYPLDMHFSVYVVTK